MSLIVSLTSTSARLPILKFTLLSLFEQSLPADRIVLNLSREPYLLDEGITELPDWLENWVRKHSLEINWVENTGPYRKLLPIYRQAADEDWIVTCDDDVIYGCEWLKTLVDCAKEHPESIVCGRARRPLKNLVGVRQSYLNWPVAEPDSEGKDLIPTGIAGVVYRKPLLDRHVMSSEDYRTLAPKQDDLWFNLARQNTDVSVVVAPETYSHVFPITTNQALSSTNASKKSADWNRLFSAITGRLWVRAKAVMGFSVCDNDYVLKSLDKYKP